MAETIEKILLHYQPKRENLLRAIKEINGKLDFFSDDAVRITADYFRIKPAEVSSVASFYDQIRAKKRPQLLIQVCDSINCQTKSASEIIKTIELLLKQKAGDDFNPNVKIERISCLGRCSEGPNVIINGTLYNQMDEKKVIGLLEGYL